MPKVSICIPAYKQPSLLRLALESVFIQTFTDFEIVITDDSPDNSVAIVIAEFGQHANLRYYKNNSRKGSPENWNETVRLASGELIKILHHDDWFSDKNSLAEFVKMLDDNPQADFAFSASIICDLSNKIKWVHQVSPHQIKKLRHNPSILFLNNVVGIGAPSATIFRKKVAETFDPQLKWVVDIDFYIRVLKNNSNFSYSEKPLICTSDASSNRITNECLDNKRIQIFEWLYLYKKVANDKIPFHKTCKFLFELFDKYGVRTIGDIMAVGVELPIPKIVEKILILQELLYKFKLKNFKSTIASV